MAKHHSLVTRFYDRVVLEYPRIVILGILAVVCFLGYHAADFQLDASTETLIIETDEDLRYSRMIKSRYGGYDYLLITFSPKDDLFSNESLKKLARLRANPVRDEIIRLERELTCKRLKLQVVRLRESVVGELPAATGATAVAPAMPIEDGAGSASQNGVSAAVPQPKQDGGNAAGRRSDDCQKDQETLVRLRAVPTREDVARFERELSCERLRPQVLRLRESLGE